MDDEGWEARMAERARQRAEAAAARFKPKPGDRDHWPVPEHLRGYSARDVFLWYIRDGWTKIVGDDEPVETVFDHDFGKHVLRKGPWQVALTDIDQFPTDDFNWRGPASPDGGTLTRDRCWKCGRPNPDLAHALYEYVAALLAERLRRALDDHTAGCTVCPTRGSAYCGEAMELMALLPEGDLILVG